MRIGDSRVVRVCAWVLGVVGILVLDAPSIFAQQEQQRWYVLHCGTLLAAPGDAPVLRVSVIVKGRRIAEVRNGFVDVQTLERPASVEVVAVDLEDHFVMPGLIDTHVHLSRDSEGRGNRETDADVAIRAVRAARVLLEAGVTTARDLGSRGRTVCALRDAIEQGVVPGPRLVVSGEAITPSGLYQQVSIPKLRPPAMSDVRLSPTITVDDFGGSPSSSNATAKMSGRGLVTPTSDDTTIASKTRRPLSV